MTEDAVNPEAQARVISDRMFSLFVERAVPAIRQGQLFQTWALDRADATDESDFLEGKSGAVRLCWDETVMIYQAVGAPCCEVRADPVAPDYVVEQLDSWTKATWPPFMRRASDDDTISREYIGPHPNGGFTNILASFFADPEDETIYQAHLSVAWISEDAA